jgi:hypothetical protein
LTFQTLSKNHEAETSPLISLFVKGGHDLAEIGVL